MHCSSKYFLSFQSRIQSKPIEAWEVSSPEAQRDFQDQRKQESEDIS